MKPYGTVGLKRIVDDYRETGFDINNQENMPDSWIAVLADHRRYERNSKDSCGIYKGQSTIVIGALDVEERVEGI